ncbi:MAG TPA: FtsK/SpoIIIE domain-containing protein, partial [Arthrobacter sp.]
LDLAASPHTLINGACGTGKSVMLRALAMSALDNGFDVVAIDTIMMALNFRTLEGKATIARDGEAAVAALSDIVAEMGRRKELLRTHSVSVSRWVELPESVLAAENVRPILVVIDEYASTVTPYPVPKSLDKESEEFLEVLAHNATADRIKRLTAKLLREARFVGIHLVISTQRPDYVAFDGEMHANLGNVIMTVRPGKAVSPLMIDMAFSGKADKAAVSAAVATAVAAPSHGHAVLVTEHGAVTPLQFSLPANE